MTKLIRSIVFAGGLLVLAGVQNASAQIQNIIEFTTTFPFSVGNTTVPAGHYTIATLDDDPHVLELRGPHTAVLFETEDATPSQAPSKDEVVFSRYGNGYVLKNIWLEGSEMGYVSKTALAELRIAKKGGSPTEHRVSGHKGSRTTAAPRTPASK